MAGGKERKLGPTPSQTSEMQGYYTHAHTHAPNCLEEGTVHILMLSKYHNSKLSPLLTEMEKMKAL